MRISFTFKKKWLLIHYLLCLLLMAGCTASSEEDVIQPPDNSADIIFTVSDSPTPTPLIEVDSNDGTEVSESPDNAEDVNASHTATPSNQSDMGTINNNSGSQNSNSGNGRSDRNEFSSGQTGKTDEHADMDKEAYTQGDYKYRTNNDGTVTIIKYLGAGGNVVVPTELDGKPVTAIGYTSDDFKGAFQDHVQLTSVIIPDGVTEIKDNAFYDCIGLTTVTVPASVKVIWNCAFSGCTSLEAIYFEGDAPQFANYVLESTEPVLYYHEGASGWTNPFYGCVTVIY